MFNFFRLLAIPLLLAATLCPGGEPQQQDSSSLRTSPLRSKHELGQRRKMVGIGNFGEVTPMLFRGGQPTYKGFQRLATSGVQIVVDTRGNRTKTEGKEVRMLGMRYVAIPWHCPLPNDEAFAKFLKLLRDNRGKKVFVHCRLGDGGTGMEIVADRVADEGRNAAEAMAAIEQVSLN